MINYDLVRSGMNGEFLSPTPRLGRADLYSLRRDSRIAIRSWSLESMYLHDRGSDLLFIQLCYQLPVRESRASKLGEGIGRINERVPH